MATYRLHDHGLESAGTGQSLEILGADHDGVLIELGRDDGSPAQLAADQRLHHPFGEILPATIWQLPISSPDSG